MEKKLIFAFIFILSLLVMPSDARSVLSYGDIIPNGGFQIYNSTEMTADGQSTPIQYNWFYDTTPGCEREGIPDLESQYGCEIVNATWCQSQGFADECLVMQSLSAKSTMTLYSFYPVQFYNNSSPILTIYARTLADHHTTANRVEFHVIDAQTNATVFGALDNSNNITTVVKKFQFNFTGNLTVGHKYLLYIKMNPISLNNFIFDNITLGSSPFQFTQLKTTCQAYYPISGWPSDISVSCSPTPLDIGGCQILSNVSIANTITLWNASFDNIFYSSTFNNTLHTIQHTNTASPPTNIFGATDYDSPLTIYGNSSTITGTCAYQKNATTNASLFSIVCSVYADCGTNITTLTDCSSFCSNGILYRNGTYDSTLKTCQNFAYTETCPLGFCASVSSCSSESFIFINQTQALFGLNTTALTNSYIGIFTTPVGYFLVFFLIVELGLYYILNEFFSLVVFTILNVIFGLLGFFPSWVGLVMALVGVEVILLNMNFFGGQKNAG